MYTTTVAHTHLHYYNADTLNLGAQRTILFWSDYSHHTNRVVHMQNQTQRIHFPLKHEQKYCRSQKSSKFFIVLHIFT